ncbi:MAG TPA: hypothetical protein PK095_09365 [Myxococcota bacterium]|nr:hypothetical protein [Myxococcota bacterium]
MGGPLKEDGLRKDRAATEGRPYPDTGNRDDQSPCEREVDLGYTDLARISTALSIAPLSFVALTGPTPPRPTLDLAGQLVGLTLRRHDGRCAFLLTLASGRRLCGLGALAPVACLKDPSTPLPADVDRAPRPSNQAELEARWQSRIAERTRPLDPETALSGLLSMMAEAEADTP